MASRRGPRAPSGPTLDALGLFAPAIAIVAIQLVLFPMPVGAVFSGLILGMLGALGAVGLALVWRSNKVVNFAHGDLGALPATLTVLLVTIVGLNWFLAVATGLLAALVLESSSRSSS